jgi:hypothetical protein
MNEALEEVRQILRRQRNVPFDKPDISVCKPRIRSSSSSARLRAEFLF